MFERPKASPIITQEVLDMLKARDKRWEHVDLYLKIERELAESVAVKLLIETANREAEQCKTDLAFCDPTDVRKIVDLQARIYRAYFIGETLQACLTRGVDAVRNLDEDGPVNIEDQIEGEDAHPKG